MQHAQMLRTFPVLPPGHRLRASLLLCPGGLRSPSLLLRSGGLLHVVHLSEPDGAEW